MQAFWFGLIAVLWAGFFVLEGFDFGVGMLLPFVGRSDTERKVALRSIGPVWDGNEVWLIVAGGATFAAFPEWYATMFSGFYIAFFLLLVGLILRGIGIEYRGKSETAKGRRYCDWAIVVGSLLPALLLGVAFADFMRGVAMNPAHDMTGGFFALLTPYAVLGGLFSLLFFAFHGAVFLLLRTDGAVHDQARQAALALVGPVAVLAVAFVVWTATLRGGVLSVMLGVLIIVLCAAAGLLTRRSREGWAFVASSLVAALIPVWVFAALWPNVLPDLHNPALSLTIHNASSTPYTLAVMTVVALVFTPVVLAYQAWTYWVFRARVTGDIGSGDGHGGVGLILAQARTSARHTFGAPTAPPRDAAPTPSP